MSGIYFIEDRQGAYDSLEALLMLLWELKLRDKNLMSFELGEYIDRIDGGEF